MVSSYRAYSCGNGLEYHVSMSHGPNSMAAGQRSWAAIAADVGDIKLCAVCDPRPAGVPIATVVEIGNIAGVANVTAARSRISLYRSTSFWVTPGASGCFSTADGSEGIVCRVRRVATYCGRVSFVCVVFSMRKVWMNMCVFV